MKIVLISLTLLLCSSLRGRITSEIKTLEQRKERQLRESRQPASKSKKANLQQRTLKDLNLDFAAAYQGKR